MTVASSSQSTAEANVVMLSFAFEEPAAAAPADATAAYAVFGAVAESGERTSAGAALPVIAGASFGACELV